jgi:hypothetical protein
VNDWKQYTRLKHCTPETPQVLWFWQVRSRNLSLSPQAQSFPRRSSNPMRLKCARVSSNSSPGLLVSLCKDSKHFKATPAQRLRDCSQFTSPLTFPFRTCRRRTLASIESTSRPTTAISSSTTSSARRWRKPADSRWNERLCGSIFTQTQNIFFCIQNKTFNLTIYRRNFDYN